MYFLCFNKSVQGMLKINCCGKKLKGSMTNYGIIGIIKSENKAENNFSEHEIYENFKEEAEYEEPLFDISSRNVLCLPLNLSVGNIEEDFFAENSVRKQNFIKRHSEFLSGSIATKEQLVKSAQEDWENAVNDYNTLLNLKKGEKVFVWIDYSCDSLCSLLFAADVLKYSNIEFEAVFVPRYKEQINGTVMDSVDWGEFDYNDLKNNLFNRRIFTKNELNALSLKWSELKRENSDLRVFLNGRIISAAKSFYDSFILNCLKQGETKAGNVLAKMIPICADDWFIFKRISYLISVGRIVLVKKDDDYFGDSVIKLSENI